MEKIEGYLKQMNLVFRVIPSEERIIVPYKIGGRVFLVSITASDRWVRFYSIIVTKDQLGKDVNIPNLHRELLVANGKLSEVKYFITEQGDVGVVGHEGVDVLTIDGFRQEYEAIPFGVSYFLKEIAPKLNLEVPGFGE